MSKKKKEEQTYKLYLAYDESESGGDVAPGQEGNNWPSYDDTHRSFYPRALHLDSLSFCETIEVPFDPAQYNYLHLVVVRYTTGSTFGTIYGAWHVEGVYRDSEEAQEIVDSINKETYKGYKPWVGYFERLESVDIQTLQVVPKNPK